MNTQRDSLTCIKSRLGKGLVYKKYGRAYVSRYSDSEYADDRGDRKSTTEYCIFGGENLMT